MPYFDSEGVKIYYETRGEGEPLVFLHGFSLDRRMWNDQTEYFAGRYRVITCDARGHGLSDAPKTGYAREDRTTDLENLANFLGLNKFHLIGLSMGGGDALSYAIDRQERLFSLTLVGTVAAGWIPSKRFHDFGPIAKEEGKEAALCKYMASTLSYYKNHNNSLGEVLSKIMLDFSGGPWLDPMKGKYKKRDDLSHVEKLRIPLLIVNGQRDIFFRPLAEKLHSLIESSHLEVIKDVGHMVNMEAPVEFNRILQNFIEETG